MAVKIENYAVIGDTETVALVADTGSIDWLCLPRFDSPACFAGLLGSDEHGHWSLAPTADATSTRHYLDGSLVLETTYTTEAGRARVYDFMPARDELPNVVRIVEGIDGEVEFSSVLRLRFDYGSVVPWVRKHDGVTVAIAGPDLVCLRADVDNVGKGWSTRSTFTVGRRDRVGFVLGWGPSHLPVPAALDPDDALAGTVEYWREWSERSTAHGEFADEINSSLRILKALTYRPTGGVVAAATTSLPEHLGGVRNWDYRYCWLRDATMTLTALLHTGYVEEARAWRDWLVRAVAGRANDLQIMYGLGGERRLDEYELDHLSGYEKSAPVRIGNAAAGQLQLDVYGEVINALALAAHAEGEVSRNSWTLIRTLLGRLEQIWQSPDEGLWEVRGPRQHFTHSKVLVWVAFDRAVELAESFGLRAPVDRWRGIRDTVHADVLAKAWNPKRKAFTQAYGSDLLDAAVLMMATLGFLPPDDERLASTVRVIDAELTEGGFVRRYEGAPPPGIDGNRPATGSPGAGEPTAPANVDGLPGREGAFLACTFWLADAYTLMGETARARELFDHLLRLRGDCGLLAEEYDPATGRQLGNTPQAFSHIGLVNTALRLEGHGPDPRRQWLTESGDAPERRP